MGSKASSSLFPLRHALGTDICDDIRLEISPHGHRKTPPLMISLSSKEQTTLGSGSRKTDDTFVLNLSEEKDKAPYVKQLSSGGKAYTCTCP